MNTGPAFGALENGCGRGLPSHWPPVSPHQKAVTRLPSAFYFHQVFFLGEDAPTLRSSKDMLPTAARGQKITCFSLRLLVYRHVTKEATFPVTTEPVEKTKIWGNVHYLFFSTFF